MENTIYEVGEVIITTVTRTESAAILWWATQIVKLIVVIYFIYLSIKVWKIYRKKYS